MRATYTFADWQSGMRPPSGFDCADAVDDGWTKAELLTFMRACAKPWPVRPAGPRPEKEMMQSTDTADDFIPFDYAPLAPVANEPIRRAEPEKARERPMPPAGPASALLSPKPSPTAPASPFKRLVPDNFEAPLLDPRNPMQSARALLADRFVKNGVPSMHHYRGTFWCWNGSCYRNADNDSVVAEIWKYLEAAQQYSKDGQKVDFQPNRGEVENVAAAFRAVCNLPGHVEAPAWLGEAQGKLQSDELLPVCNGLLHLPSGQITEPSAAFFCLNASDVTFEPGAPEPSEWLRFLNLIWPNDPASIETLQDLFGYLLSPDTSQQKIPLLVGPKRSGKGTIARVLTAVLGQDSVAAPTLASLSTNFGLAPLIGKSVAIIGDARLSGKADQSAIAERLLSISGEDSITIDRKFQAAWTGRLGVRFLIMSNELPRLSDASGALASRFVVLTMEHSFYGQEDRGLGHRLMSELSGILNWAREGYLRLRERGYFLQPDSARDAIEELEELGSPISAFIKSHCIVGSGLHVAANDIFLAWRNWCEANGRREAGTAQSFGRDLRSAVPGLRMARPRLDGEQVRQYQGIALRHQDW